LGGIRKYRSNSTPPWRMRCRRRWRSDGGDTRVAAAAGSRAAWSDGCVKGARSKGWRCGGGGDGERRDQNRRARVVRWESESGLRVDSENLKGLFAK
jgi:hypothetical protein